MDVAKKSEKVFLLLWGVASVVVVSFLMSTHMAVFRAGDPLAFGDVGPVGKKYYLHVLYAGCGCSREVAERLTRIPASTTEAHKVLWIDDGKTPMPQFAPGVIAQTVSADDPLLEQVTGAPQLVVAEAGKVVYQGGYSETKTTFVSDWIVTDIQQNRVPASLPIKGCYVPKTSGSFVSKIWKAIL